MSQMFLDLYSFAKKKNIITADGVAASPIHSLFHLPLSQQAHMQMVHLQNILDGFSVNNTPGTWSYIWNSENYSVKRTYKHLSGQLNIHPALKWLWGCSCQPKHKVFFWLVLKDIISTRGLLKRKNMVLQDYNCVLCNANVEESLFHLLLDCPFASQCWSFINIQVDPNLDPFENLQNCKDQLQVPFLMEIIVLMCWIIWKARNDLIF